MRLNYSVVELLQQYRGSLAHRTTSKQRHKKTKRDKKRKTETDVIQAGVVDRVVLTESETEQTLRPDDDEEQWGETEADDRDDPYRVRLERLTRISHDEYSTSSRCALAPSYTFSLQQLGQISRHAFWRDNQPKDHYTHDPGVLVDAVVMACHMEALARRTATQVPYEHLMVVENGDMTRIIEQLCTDETMLRQVHQTGQQYLFALMAVENATRHLPEHVRLLLPAEQQQSPPTPLQQQQQQQHGTIGDSATV